MKYIHVQNQVSLGAGETVNAKIGFEEWLWEQARLSVKHYHSDNGVFAAEIFREACIVECQLQSFSVVGAKHQNAEADHAIQTVMYMARSFMIHAALHWGSDGSDDVSLWSFAVDHAAWLYNWTPQHQSGIMPLEMITSAKSDHRDLLRSHVWGCPVYVLEPKLQDGQKLPKWNCCAHMHQFLGFSQQHSSTVAMVHNLHTGYVSPYLMTTFKPCSLMTNHSWKLTKFATSFLLKAMTVMWRMNTTKMVFLFTSHHLWMRFGYQNLNVTNATLLTFYS